MENIKIIKESKFWNENGKWCVSMMLPDYECWFENGWHKNREKAEAIALEHVKKHLTFVREMKRSAERQEIVMAL